MLCLVFIVCICLSVYPVVIFLYYYRTNLKARLKSQLHDAGLEGDATRDIRHAQLEHILHEKKFEPTADMHSFIRA